MKTVTKIASLFFALMAVLHAIRLAKGWSVEVAGVTVPLWVSGVAVVVAGVLAWGLWKESRYSRNA